MQSFIISHSSCAEQYGDMSPDTHTHAQAHARTHTRTHAHTHTRTHAHTHTGAHTQAHARTHTRTHAHTHTRTHAHTHTHTHTQLKWYSWLSNYCSWPYQYNNLYGKINLIHMYVTVLIVCIVVVDCSASLNNNDTAIDLLHSSQAATSCFGWSNSRY